MSSTKDQQLQHKVNEMSLLFQVSEDVVKAVREADLPPSMLDVMLKMHNTQVEIDNQLKEMRKGQIAMARLIDQVVDGAVANRSLIEGLSNAQGIDLASLINPENIDPTTGEG